MSTSFKAEFTRLGQSEPAEADKILARAERNAAARPTPDRGLLAHLRRGRKILGRLIATSSTADLGDEIRARTGGKMPQTIAEAIRIFPEKKAELEKLAKNLHL